MIKKSIHLLAIIFFLLACTNKEKEVNKLTNSALLKIENSNFNDAIIDLNKAIKLSPNNSKLYYIRGNTFFNIQQYSNAIADYDKAIEINEKYTDAYYNRANTYLLLDNIDKACSDFTTAYKLGKPNIEEKVRRCKQ